MIEHDLIIALADAYHTSAMIFVTETAATVHTTLTGEDHACIVDAASVLPPGFYRLVQRQGVTLGELVDVSDQDAIGMLVQAGMIGRMTRH